MGSSEVTAGLLGGVSQAGVFSALTGPAAEGMQQRMFEKYPVKIPDILSLVTAVQKGWLQYEQAVGYAKRLGFMPEWFKIIYETYRNILQPADYITLLNRGQIDDITFREKMQRSGYGDDDVNYLKKLSLHIPSVQDFVIFAVREVFTPEVAERYGQFKDFPKDFETYAKKAGLDPEYAKFYWAAHWELPSVTQGFEMFHRRVIDRNELELLLKSQDVMPFWRDKLIQISYNPLTRVDIRRAYALGVIDLAAVESAYLDDGYSPENAKIITEFIRRDVHEELHGATKSQLISAFEDGIIDENGLRALLQELNYGAVAIDLIVSQAQYDILYKYLKSVEQLLNEQVKAGQITVEDAIQELYKQDAPATWMAAAENRLKRLSITRRRLPTLEQLQRFMKKGLIEEAVFIKRVTDMGYTPDDALLFASDARA